MKSNPITRLLLCDVNCQHYCIELATEENALFAFDPIRRIVPTTRTRITASMTAYSAMSCPESSDSILHMTSDMHTSNRANLFDRRRKRKRCRHNAAATGACQI